MGWQAPRYIYPQPDTPQYGQALISGLKEGAMMGVSMGGKIKAAAEKKSLESDLNQITVDADKKLEALKTPEAAPAAAPVAPTPVATPAPATVPAAPVAGAPAPQITGDKALAMANMAPAPTATPAPTAPTGDENQIKRIEINADMHNKMIKAYYKHGKIEEAQMMESKYMDQTLKLGSIDHKAAQKVWNSSFLKDKYGEIDFTPKPKFKVVGDHGSYVRVNETTGDVTPIQSVGELKSLDPKDNVYMKVTDKNGNITWNQVQFGKPADEDKPIILGEGAQMRDKNGKLIAENTKDFKTGGADGSIKDGKTAQKHLDDWFVQKYAGDMVEETGKAPDKNTVLAKNGNKAVEGKMINGKPVPLQELHDAMQAYYERQIEGGAKPAEALNNTLQFGQQYGSTKKETDFSKVTPAQYEQAGVDKATVSTINAKIAEYKKKGVNLKDVRINKKGGYIEYVPDKGEAERVLISKPAAKAAAKSTTPAKTAEKPTEKPAEKPATTPAAQPAAKAAAAQKSTVSDLEKKTGIGGTDDKQIAEATRKKRIEKLTKEIDQKSIDAQVEEVASYQSRRFGVPIGFARKRARALIEKEIAAKKTELASLQK